MRQYLECGDDLTIIIPTNLTLEDLPIH